MRLLFTLSLFSFYSSSFSDAFVIRSSTQSANILILSFVEKGEDGQQLEFSSPVMQQVFPKLLEWKTKYGHPNIPLGSSEGRQCQTLRRLHIQQKLTDKEVDWLDSLGFIFNSLEDVYRDVDFDQLFDRLMDYEAKNPYSNFQVPKKCAEDPELGAWVTGIRRLKKEGVDPEHAKKLDEVGFAWVSTRKCGSKFMLKYTEFVARAEQEGLEALLQDSEVTKWVVAQQEALKRESLSHTRTHYMDELFGESWTSIGNEQ
jgi:hypothetical protein